MIKHLIFTLIASVGLYVGTNSFSQEHKGPWVGDKAVDTAEDQRINAFMVGNIIGSKVINLNGETLGKIENFVVDIDTGRIIYAIIESGGFLGVGEKLFPVPWKSLAALPSEGIFFLNQSKDKMEKAPAFEKKNLPNLGDVRWGVNVLKYYGVPSVYAPWEPLIGYDYGYYDYHDANYPSSPGAGISPASRAEDPYRKIFDFKTITIISGQVIKLDQVPEFGFGLQLRLTVYIEKNKILPVYLGPAFYLVGPWQAKHFKLGDKVTVSGSQVTVGGETSIIAMTVKQGNEVLRLRDKEGIPEWIGWKKATN